MMLWWVLQNLVIAALLSVVVLLVIRAGRPGPVARHALWLVVLVKLAAPPLVVLEWPWASSMGRMTDAWHALSRGPATPIVVLEPQLPATAPSAPAPAIDSQFLIAQPVADLIPATPAFVAPAGPVSRVNAVNAASNVAFQMPAIRAIAAVSSGIWIAGGAIFLLIQGLRTLRMARMARRSVAADAMLAHQVSAVAQQIGVQSIRVRVVNGLTAPLVWGITPFRPYLLWPASLEAGLSTDCRRALIVHELAHVKRLDHWVGWLELAAGALWWWNPLFWYVRSQVQENAELACDAWVVKDQPDGRRSYAEALLAVCASAGPSSHPMPAVGMTTGTDRFLERRLVMIMRETVPLRLSRVALSGLAVLTFATLPAWTGQLDAAPQNVDALTAVLARETSPDAVPARQTPQADVTVLPPGQTLPAGAPAPAGRGQPPPRDNNAPQTGTARVRGIVTTIDGAPLLRAQVRLSGGGLAEARTVATDAAGCYEVKDLPAGRFTLEASKGAYLKLAYGQRRPFETARPLEVANGQQLEDVNFSLPLGGAVVVRVTDEFGEPLADVPVKLLQYTFNSATPEGRALTPVDVNPSAFPDATDDLGEVRLFGIPPGQYVVSAAPRATMAVGPADRGLSYAETYYPGTVMVGDAERVTVAIGKEVNVSIPLGTTRASVISGVVRDSNRSPVAQARVALSEYYGSGVRSQGAWGTTTQADGSFRIPGILPGNYSLSARTGAADAVRAEVPITVTGSDIANLEVIPTTPGEIHGKILFDPEGPRGLTPSTTSIGAANVRMIGQNRTAIVHDDWSFEIKDLAEPRFVRMIGAPPMAGWYLKAVMLDGRDVIDTPIDMSGGRVITGVQVMLTRIRAGLAGSVAGDDGKPVSEYAAILFPQDRALWTPQSRYVAAARPDQQGAFRFTGLPPGRYLAAAVDYLPRGGERDPDLLARLRGAAQAVTLVDGETPTVKLKLVSN